MAADRLPHLLGEPFGTGALHGPSVSPHTQRDKGPAPAVTQAIAAAHARIFA